MDSFEFQPLATKLLPPRVSRHVLHRQRLVDQLARSIDFPLTIVRAGPGYGKSTMLSAQTAVSPSVAWLTLYQEDVTPRRFLTYLVHSFGRVSAAITKRPLILLEQNPTIVPKRIIDACINGVSEFQTSIQLIIDDAQWLTINAESQELLNYLLTFAPPNLSTILATRSPLELPVEQKLQLKGQLLEIDQKMLAFTPKEIEDLFANCYKQPITASQSTQLWVWSEGWPIVFPLIEQQLRQGRTIDDALIASSQTDSNLVDYLTQQTLAQFSPDVRHFLRITSVLNTLSPDICDFVLQSDKSEAVLNQLQENGLFTIILGKSKVRYHHLFRDFLYHQLSTIERQQAHHRAGQFLKQAGEFEEAIEQFIAANAEEEAAPLLDEFGNQLIGSGRLDDMATWISNLSPEQIANRPNLLLQLGDIARLQSRYESALGWYQQAETLYRNHENRLGIGRALRGQARVYLDTIRPAQAEKLLQDALKLSDGQDDREGQARLLDLLAENLLNQGKVQQANSYQHQAKQLRHEGPSSAELPVRLMLRTGRLHEARAVLEMRVIQERKAPVLQPRAHRETLLLLSLIMAMQGEAKLAAQFAAEGTERAKQLNSPFTLSVGFMREGAAWLLQKNKTGYEKAQACFEQAIEFSQQLNLPRLKVEAIWGLAQVWGFQNNLKEAEKVAKQGIQIARAAGDEWIASLIEVTLGASYVLAASGSQAVQWLNRAQTHADECGDHHISATARLWLAYLWHQQNDLIRLEVDLIELLKLIANYQYTFLFIKKTLLGPPDPRCLVPLLLFAREAQIETTTVNDILRELELSTLEYHPGYQLRIFTFGGFRAFRGDEEVKWKRQAAKDLFQLLLTKSNKMLHREEIMGLLWPEATASEAGRHFKTAYSALCRELEPDRQRNTPSAYIIRDGTQYGLRQTADIWVDSQQFERQIAVADSLLEQKEQMATYLEALSLYKGAYLSDAPYAEWLTQQRRQLHNRFLRASERLAELQMQAEGWEQLVETADNMLVVDHCWEPAYRYLMIANANMGNLAEVSHIYERCVETMQHNLDLHPSQETEALRQQLIRPPTINPKLGFLSEQ